MMTFRQLVGLVSTLTLVAMPIRAQGTTKAAAPATAQKAAPTPAAAKAAAVEPIDINTATKEQLMAVKGIGDAYAGKIIAGRPYKSKDQLWRKKVLPKGVYDSVKDLLIAKQK